MPVPIYLEWEIKFNDKYLKGNLQRFVPFAPFWDICVRNQVKITVRQMRALAAGAPHPHPDDNAIALGKREPGTSRGDLFVYMDAPDEPDDGKIPVEVAVYYAMLKTKELGDSSILKGRESGGLSFDEIKAEYADLFGMAKIESFDQLKAAFPAEFPD